MEKVVLAYSGGLDTSVIIRWLQEKYGMEVVTLTVNLGQKENMKEIEAKAKALGAVKHYSIDAREEFVEGYIYPAIKANALYEGKYPLGSALSRPLIASKLVQLARKEGATAIAHGCTGKGNDQVRFDVTAKALAPDLKIIAPVREWGMSREAELEYAKKHGIPIPPFKNPYSIDQNLWGRSIECGPIDLPDQEPPEDAFEWTPNPEKAPEKPEYVTIAFNRGVPMKLDGKKMGGVELIDRLNAVAGRNSVGRIDHIEDRLVGIKSREVYESPAATCLLEAHSDLEKMVLTRHELAFKAMVDAQWAWLVYTGLWADPLREDLEAFINTAQERVSGEVRLKLYKGGVRVVGRSSPNSLYNLGLATYKAESTFDQSAATGFVELWGLQTRAAHGLKPREKVKK